ncbi:hypothetical protein T08_2536 [Trichinella sp. T8]|nr:hypothetical protein T08_2536 [Trichinella sp. T8]
MKGKHLLVLGWDNLKGPIPVPAVTLNQQPHISLDYKNENNTDFVLVCSAVSRRSCRLAGCRGYVRDRLLYIVPGLPPRWNVRGVSKMVEVLLGSSS